MSASVATGLAITNPLVKYRALLATRAIAPDPVLSLSAILNLLLCVHQSNHSLTGATSTRHSLGKTVRPAEGL